MRMALVTNNPAPYRIIAWNRVGEKLGDDFTVIFCSPRESNRQWDFSAIRFRHIFLKENVYRKKDGVTYVHNNRDVWKHLKQLNPDVVITGGFNPTMLYAFFYCMFYRKKHIPMSDSWALLEDRLSVAHKILRKVVYRFSKTFIACSEKGKKYFESYNILPERIFISPLIIDNNVFSNSNSTHHSRPYDLLFSGRLIESKNPAFFVQVAEAIRREFKRDLRLLIIGDGPLRDQIISQLDAVKLDYTYPGYVSQEQLPFYYGAAKLLLFPTAFDAWGVIANEAQSAGTPVIVSPYAGCSGELVIDQYNGFVAPLDLRLWVDKCIELLGNESLWKTYSERARETAKEFNAEKAAAALIEACRSAVEIDSK